MQRSEDTKRSLPSDELEEIVPRLDSWLVPHREVSLLELLET